MIRYSKISRRPQIFSHLFSASPSQFEKILQKTMPLWEEKVINKYKRCGRPHKLELSEMLLGVLLYYRSYITQEFVGYLFGLDNAQICRFVRKLEPILAGVFCISKQKKLSKEEVECLIIDATEQPIERPKRGQKPYYSGKKKHHTLKTEIRINTKGRIVHVSKSLPGSVHDF